jgi:hypothetical protein
VKKNILMICTCFLLLLSLSCGRNVTRTEDGSFVFGFMDTKDYSSSLVWLSMKQVSPVTKEPYFGAAVDPKGYFWYYNVKRGSYRISSFAAQPGCLSFGPDTYDFIFPEYGDNSVLVKIDRPTVLFVGSYKVKKIKTGFFEEEKFQIGRTAQPTEKEVLGAILPKVEKTPWYPVLKDYYNKLK